MESWFRGILYVALELAFVMVVVTYLKRRVAAKKGSDFWLKHRHERIVPAAVLLGTGTGLLVSLATLRAPSELILVTGSLLATALVCAFVTLVWQVSAHSATVAHAAVWAPIILGGSGLILTVAAPVVLWARVAEERHTVAQALVGAAIGTVITVLAAVTV